MKVVGNVDESKINGITVPRLLMIRRFPWDVVIAPFGYLSCYDKYHVVTLIREPETFPGMSATASDFRLGWKPSDGFQPEPDDISVSIMTSHIMCRDIILTESWVDLVRFRYGDFLLPCS